MIPLFLWLYKFSCTISLIIYIYIYIKDVYGSYWLFGDLKEDQMLQ